MVNIPLWTKRDDDEKIKIDVLGTIAKKAARLLYGKGMSITSENEDDITQERIEDIIKHNEFYQLNFDREIQNSKHGDMFWGVEHRGGMPVIYVNDKPDNAPKSEVAYVNRQKTAAIIWRKQILDNIHIWIMEMHEVSKLDGVRIRRKFMVKGKWVRLQWLIKKVDKDQILPEEEHFPEEQQLRVFRVANLPAVYGASQGDLAGNESAEVAIKRTMEALMHELTVNRTILHGSLTASQKKKLKKNKTSTLVSTLLQHAYIETKGDTTKGDSPILEITQADPKLENYWKAYWQAWDNAFTLSGYARRDQHQGQTYKNADEVFFSLRDDLETTELKRSMRQKTLISLWEKIAELEKIYGWGDLGKINVIINDTFITDDQNSVEKLIQMINEGLMSRVEGIAKLRNISIQEAEQVVKQIEEGLANDPFLQRKEEEDNKDNKNKNDNGGK